MKALLLKNFYELKYKTSFVLIVMAILAALPASNMSAFAILWVSIMPTTVMAYDERSKWMRLEKMMPFSSLDIVLSKYITGYAGIGTITLIGIISRLICKAVKLTGNVYSLDIAPLLLLALMGTILLSVSFPVILKFGVEKGRWINVIFVSVIFAITTMFSVSKKCDSLMTYTNTPNMGVTLFIAFVAAVIVNLISIKISTYIQKNKNK